MSEKESQSPSSASSVLPEHYPEVEVETHGMGEKLNRLRAAVLGANDGIVSTAAVVVGVAGATNSLREIATAGVAALVGGAVSMALGEYVSVSSQRDAEEAAIETERGLHDVDPEAELNHLVQAYKNSGLSEETAIAVARERTRIDPLGAHLEIHYGIDQEDLVNPWSAATASFISFFLGALLPLVAVLLAPEMARVVVTVVVTLIALAITGAISAKLGGAKPAKAVVRLVVGGGLALAVTYLVGTLLGTGMA
ncbi:VIT1/CCC1 transporter family protein [Corynebacterium meitnerae]|uniref:VIT family protein n=1 Tax=Corynebacterium meitnerae TaxID=2913498 RepID=A0A9X3RJF4_9CORY|nr:VIT family protein [Corynebacterium meitnerae]MCZ9293945.1 VIT family protein [Corynebacterium meitnerae]